MQLEVLNQYKSGRLLQEANKPTLISGHGRLKRADDTFEDIGGSTGGFVRTVLHDWAPTDLKDFDESSVDIGGSTGGFVRTVLDDWGPPELTDFLGDWRLRQDHS